MVSMKIIFLFYTWNFYISKEYVQCFKVIYKICKSIFINKGKYIPSINFSKLASSIFSFYLIFMAKILNIIIQATTKKSIHMDIKHIIFLDIEDMLQSERRIKETI